MREIIFKDVTSRNRRKEISVYEAVENDGVVAISERYSRYTLRRRVLVDNQDDLQSWIQTNIISQKPKLRRLDIMKSHNTRLAEDLYSYIAVGNFYVLTKNEVLSFIFTESFKIRFIDLCKARECNPY
ncbi:MAG: hypothetical protein JW844_02025 [Candidatus Omnitrophica bacterium]|nr:hypothetical protein [Candidatus Omnitrophota bacterium]